MRRHFYLIIFIFIFISGMSVSYSQDQNADPVKGNEIEKNLDSKSNNASLEGAGGSHQERDAKALVNKDDRDEPEKPKSTRTRSEEKTQVDTANDTTNIKGNETGATSTGDDGVNKTDQTLQMPVKLRSDLFLINRLREVDDEDYKYTRIPEFKKEKKIDQTKLPDITIDKDKSEIEKPVSDVNEDDNEKGLFGLSKNTSDLLTKGSFILFILAIIVLYRLRSKGNSRTVLRRFPKR